MRNARDRLALLVAALVLAAAAALAWPYFPMPFLALARACRLLGLLAFLVAGFAGWGHLLCGWASTAEVPWTTKAAAGAALTATVWGYLAPWWLPNTVMAVLWLLSGVAVALRRQLPPLLARSNESSSAVGPSGLSPLAPSRSSWFPWVLALLFLQAPLLVALAPPVAVDSLIYHLAVPKQAALAGRLFDMPWLDSSYFPLHGEMLFSLALRLDRGGQLPQLVHLMAALAAIWTAARLAGRLFGPAAAGWTALLLATAPVLNLIAGVAGNDWFVVLYVALALEQHVRKGEEPGARALEAIFLGAAAATKYTALPALVLLVLPLRQLSWRRLTAPVGLVLVMALPWYGRNLLLRHDPIYPLLASGSGQAAGSHANYRGEAPPAQRVMGYLFEPELLDESPGLLLPAAGVLAVLVLPGRRKIPSGIFALMALYLLPVVFLHPGTRAFAPLLLIASILGGGALSEVGASPPVRRAVYTVTLLALPIHLAIILCVWELDGDRPLRVVAGLQSEVDYLRQSQPYIDAFRAISKQATADAKVLMIGESRAFYLDRPAIFTTAFGPPPLAAFAGSPPDAETAWRNLRAAGVRLVYYYPKRVHLGTRPAGIPYWLEFYTPRELDRAIAGLLTSHAHAVYRHEGAWIFALDEAPPDAHDAAATALEPAR